MAGFPRISAGPQLRLVEFNQQVLDNLDRIITALEDDHEEPEDAADAS
ncbi:hypothetical protein HD597_000334 [Nonomuraea thailandensis]|uniref:Uncharacterized protein n=1 Tax=Nonomuraea thailandensis TaxID=1188745 RepID=A0A9X2G9J9_9ACTN|nr:hypothetical protein [Nonomuraea thailandensis]MCP2353314.1 hypothetical protein [Nonomuraea thailandensis]